MKKLIICLLGLISLNAFAARPETTLVCLASGSVDSIKKIEVVNTDLTGQINASISIQNGTRVSTSQFNSNGSIEDTKILLSEVDTGPFGINSIYLEKTSAGYSVVKYNLCNFYYQEETCSPNATPEETARDSKVLCQKI
jgi:hypothetical protein